MCIRGCAHVCFSMFGGFAALNNKVSAGAMKKLEAFIAKQAAPAAAAAAGSSAATTTTATTSDGAEHVVVYAERYQ